MDDCIPPNTEQLVISPEAIKMTAIANQRSNCSIESMCSDYKIGSENTFNPSEVVKGINFIRKKGYAISNNTVGTLLEIAYQTDSPFLRVVELYCDQTGNLKNTFNLLSAAQLEDVSVEGNFGEDISDFYERQKESIFSNL